jgi:hypothetical protein
MHSLKNPLIHSSKNKKIKKSSRSHNLKRGKGRLSAHSGGRGTFERHSRMMQNKHINTN